MANYFFSPFNATKKQSKRIQTKSSIRTLNESPFSCIRVFRRFLKKCANFATMNSNHIASDQQKVKAIKKRNVLSFIIFVLLVLACIALHYTLPGKAAHNPAPKAPQATTK